MPRNGNVDWHPERFRARLDALMLRRIHTVGGVGRTRARLQASRPGTRRLRSLPGEPPRHQTGKYVRSIVHRVGKSGAFVWTAILSTASYSVFLDRGTPRMAPRPNLTRMLHDLRETFYSLMVRGR